MKRLSLRAACPRFCGEVAVLFQKRGLGFPSETRASPRGRA